MKQLWIASFLGLLMFSNCFRAEGEIANATCKVLDGQGNAMSNVTISLVTSDSFLPTQLRVEQQQITNRLGMVSFTFPFQQKLNWFLKGENQGEMQPVEMPRISNAKNEPDHFVILYDSLMQIRVRLKGTLPNMEKGQIAFQLWEHEFISFRQAFPILPTVTTFDSIFQGRAFSQLELRIWGGITVRDSFVARSFRIPKGAKRDTVFTLQL